MLAGRIIVGNQVRRYIGVDLTPEIQAQHASVLRGDEVQRYDIASPRQTDSVESLSCRFPYGFRINGFFTEKVLGCA